MKKIICMLIGMILIFPLVSAADMAYITRGTSYVDDNIVDAINELGYSVDYIDDSDIRITDFYLYRIILVPDQNFGSYADDIPVNEIKSLILNTYHMDDWHWINDGVSQTASSQPLDANVVDFASKITEGIPINFQVYTQAKDNGVGIPMYYLSKYKRAIQINKIVSTEGDSLNSVIATTDKGTELKDGYVSNAKGVFFGITKSEYWTQNSKQLFQNSIVWLMEGEDRDGDGFFTDYDCDDDDFSINPNATEIPYDGIDQNCDGFDLTDVDEDGFDAEIVGGNDCNDNDAEYNINSTDLTKNCRNDAPIIESIADIIIYEKENVSFYVHATDPENDNLIYSVNDSRFEQNENYFVWQTDCEDEGEYIFTITVGDGQVFSETEFKVEVKNTNRAPELINNIPVQTWEEDTNHSLNLSEYFVDYDGDAISFNLYNTSSDKNITLENLVEGTAYFSVYENWFGEDWIIFEASDGKDKILTNKIILNVTPVNDAPFMLKDFEDITFNEDTNYTINLKEYFFDIDSELQYGAMGNKNITIEMQNSTVLLVPEKDWFGTEEIAFFAIDEELFPVYSNYFNVEIIDVGESPAFETMNCNTTILEDEEESCELNASDFEGDEFNFSVVSEDNLNCEINNGKLNYKSFQDYNGEASCLIKVEDKDGYNTFLFEVNITPVNDAPVITNYFPKKEFLRIIEGRSQKFEIEIYDIDSETEINWFVNSEQVNSGEQYIFNKETGDYLVEAMVTDSELNANQLWNVIVGSTSEFTCDEVGGNICSKNQFCPGEIIDVSNTEFCCSVGCLKKPPEFADASQCFEKSDLIEITIKDPDDSDDFEIGETIKIKLKIKNKFDEKLDFDIEVYLYDLDEDESVKDAEDDIKIKPGKSETIELEIKIPDDVEENDFAIYVFVEDEEERCNSEYVEIDIEREKHKVIIENIEITPELVSPGNDIKVKVDIENIGSSDEDFYIKIENSELNISEKTEEFEIEEYGEDDKETKTFYVKIPENAEEKDYEIKATVVFDDDEDSEVESFGVSKKTNATKKDVFIQYDEIKLVEKAEPIYLYSPIDVKKKQETITLDYQEIPKVEDETIVIEFKEADKKFEEKIEKASLNYSPYANHIFIGIILLIGIIIILICIVLVRRRYS